MEVWVDRYLGGPQVGEWSSSEVGMNGVEPLAGASRCILGMLRGEDILDASE